MIGHYFWKVVCEVKFALSPFVLSLSFEFELIIKHKDVLKGWDAVSNPNSNIPVLSTAAADAGNLGQTSVDTYLASSDYLNLNNVSFGYTFPKQLVQRMYINNIRVYVTAENLFLVSARKGLDPRTYMGVGGYTSGAALIGGGGYPAMRSVTAGIQLTF